MANMGSSLPGVLALMLASNLLAVPKVMGDVDVTRMEPLSAPGSWGADPYESPSKRLELWALPSPCPFLCST